MGLFQNPDDVRGARVWVPAVLLGACIFIVSARAAAEPTGPAANPVPPSAEQFGAAVPLGQGGAGTGAERFVSAEETPVPPQAPLRPRALVLFGGVTQLNLDGDRYPDPVVVSTFGFQGAYRLRRGEVAVDVGLGGNLLILPYDSVDTGLAENSWIATALASVRGGVVSDSGLGAGLNLGIGLGFWGGLKQGNAFTVDAAPADGPVPLPVLTIGVDGEWEHESGVFLRLAVNYMVASTPGKVLRQTVVGLDRLELLLAIGFRF